MQSVIKVATTMPGLGEAILPGCAIIIPGFTTFLRPSNLVITTDALDPWVQTLARGDITETPMGHKVTVSLTKKQMFILPILPAEGPACPVLTWLNYAATYSRPPTTAKALIDNLTGAELYIIQLAPPYFWCHMSQSSMPRRLVI